MFTLCFKINVSLSCACCRIHYFLRLITICDQLSSGSHQLKLECFLRWRVLGEIFCSLITYLHQCLAETKLNFIQIQMSEVYFIIMFWENRFLRFFQSFITIDYQIDYNSCIINKPMISTIISRSLFLQVLFDDIYFILCEFVSVG